MEEDADNKRNGFKLLNDRLLSMVSFGYALLEPMACELCIVGCAVGGTLGMMRNGVNGFATRAGDSGTLTDAMPWCYSVFGVQSSRMLAIMVCRERHFSSPRDHRQR